MKLKYKVFILFLCISVASHATSSSCLSKAVTLPEGKTTLKLILKSFSDQTGCAFSYNPLIVVDNQIINVIAISDVSLSKALSKVLPPTIEFTLRGKYILLQRKSENKVEKPNTLSKTESIINKDPKKVALVIPVVTDNDLYFSRIKSTVKDTLIYILPAEQVSIVTDTNSVRNSVKSSFYRSNIDSVEVRRIKTEQFLRKNVLTHVGVSSSSPLSSVLVQIGGYGLYGIFTLSTDYNNSYRMGYGIGYTYSFQNNMGINFNAERSLLFAGESFDLGVRAILTHCDPLVTFAISRDFTLFMGPTFYMSESSYINANTDLGKTYGVGVLIGVKFNLISALLAKK